MPRPSAASLHLLLLAGLASGCVLDRTGRSASDELHRKLLLQESRTGNLETMAQNLNDRVGQLEELTRARGQEEILRMETLDQVRTEVAHLRGEVELLQHDLGKRVTDGQARADDAAFRLQWLEDRAAQLEKSLGLKPTPAPKSALIDGAGAAEPAATSQATGDGEAAPTEASSSADEAVTDPKAMLELAKKHLVEDRPKAAEAVLLRFIEQHPKDPNLAEARYRLAEASFNAKSYTQALQRFQEVLDKHPNSQWSPWALLRQGECFEKQGRKENAKLFYDELVRLYPKSQAAKDAKARMGGKSP